MTDWTGRNIGKYEIENLIGHGGMADVYKGVQISLGRAVAVKVIHPHLAATEGFIDRFRREARLVGQLRHGNIVQVIDFDVYEGVYFMVMEYIPGETLDARLRRLRDDGQRLPLGEARRIFHPLCDAVGYAHQMGVVHRDLKPSNVMFAARDVPVLSDFGIAKIVGMTNLTMTGTVTGTPLYLAPEQAQGRPVDARADIYSLGVMLYEMVAGRVPFDGDTPFAIIMKHVTEAPQPPRTLNPELPEAVETVVLRALQKDPAARYQQASDLADAFASACGGAATTLPAGTAFAAATTAAGTVRQVDEVPAEAAPAPLTQVMSAPPAPPTQVAAASPPLPAQIAGPATPSPVVPAVPAPPAEAATGAPPRAPAVAPASPATPAPAALAAPPAAAPVGETSGTRPRRRWWYVLAIGVVLAGAFFALRIAGRARERAAEPTAVANPTAAPPLQPTSAPRPVLTRIAVPRTMVEVPAGMFVMGDDEGPEDVRPAHRVELPTYWIDAAEVTNHEFSQFVAATKYATDAERAGSKFTWSEPQPGLPSLERPRLPVVWVSWNDARAYCEWAGKRLPTSAEWERAARGDTGLRWPWGMNFVPEALNWAGTQSGGPMQVGSFPGAASPFGAMDMAGNVWEWVLDWWAPDAYRTGPTADPHGPGDGKERVLRGGSYREDLAQFHSIAFVKAAPPDAFDGANGFRCALRP